MASILIATGTYFPDMPGGADRLAYDLACTMVSKGHEVWILCQDVLSLKKLYEQIDDINILRYSISKSSIINSSRHREHIEQAINALKEHEVKMDILHGHVPLQYVAALRYAREMKPLACYTIHSPAVMEMDIVWKNQGIAGNIKRYLGLPVLKKIERECLEMSERLTCESIFTKAKIKEIYGSSISRSIEVIPGWVDEKKFSPKGCKDSLRAKLKWESEGTIFFCLRRLAPRMGFENLLKACRILRREGLHFKLYIGGTGPLENKLKHLSSDYGLDQHVEFLGYIEDEELAQMYTACDASVIPTEWLECFGLIALECLSCGTPVLATPVGALPEIIRNFSKDWISKTNSPESIAEIMRNFIAGNLKELTSEEIRDRAVEYYNKAHSIDKYISIYGLS